MAAGMVLGRDAKFFEESLDISAENPHHAM
jgi:hypothetical protein